jgi:hypothetical protein
MKLDCIEEDHELSIAYETTPVPTKWHAKKGYYYTGLTYAFLIVKDWTFLGVSKCNPDDSFDKNMAKIVAIGRAISAYAVNKKGVMAYPEEKVAMLKTSYHILGLSLEKQLPQGITAFTGDKHGNTHLQNRLQEQTSHQNKTNL